MSCHDSIYGKLLQFSVRKVFLTTVRGSYEKYERVTHATNVIISSSSYQSVQSIEGHIVHSQKVGSLIVLVLYEYEYE